MKLKLDLHPIFNDTGKIESSLAAIIAEAVEKRATEIEIIPGKGSGALKKTVLRFLDRPDIKSRYHRLEKDSDNWGRLFVHFRHERAAEGRQAPVARPTVTVECVCCQALITVEPDDDLAPRVIDCPSCASPNRVTFGRDRRNILRGRAEWGYE